MLVGEPDPVSFGVELVAPLDVLLAHFYLPSWCVYFTLGPVVR